jgi:GAF domain-containing protein
MRSAARGTDGAPCDHERAVLAAIDQAQRKGAQPVAVFRLTLGRVTPLVGARFSSVFVRDAAEPALLRLACAHNWPQSAARHLGRLRIRSGRGPTGRAVAECRIVEAPDVFADDALRDWWEPARELGFASLIALPLATGRDAAGALSFYFEAAHSLGDDERRLLVRVADRLSTNVVRQSGSGARPG